MFPDIYAAVKAAVQGPDDDTPPLKILVIGGGLSYRVCLESYLRSAGYFVLSIDAGDDVHPLLVSFQPGMVIVDVDDGQFSAPLDVARLITPPIVLVVAGAGANLQPTVIKCHVNGYIQKPVTATVIETVDALFERSRRPMNELVRLLHV